MECLDNILQKPDFNIFAVSFPDTEYLYMLEEKKYT